MRDGDPARIPPRGAGQWRRQALPNEANGEFVLLFNAIRFNMGGERWREFAMPRRCGGLCADRELGSIINFCGRASSPYESRRDESDLQARRAE
jgi:hypothetical protein